MLTPFRRGIDRLDKELNQELLADIATGAVVPKPPPGHKTVRWLLGTTLHVLALVCALHMGAENGRPHSMRISVLISCVRGAAVSVSRCPFLLLLVCFAVLSTPHQP